MRIHKFDGVTICVKRKGEARVFKYPNIHEVVEDCEETNGKKWLLIRKRAGASLRTDAMFRSDKVDGWWREAPPNTEA